MMRSTIAMEHLDRMKTMDLAIPQDPKNPPLRGSIPPDVEQPLNILKMKNKKERTAEDRALGKDPEQIKDEKDKNAEKAKSGCCSKMLSGCCCSKKKSDKSEADLAIEKTTAFEEKQAAALKIMAEALRKAKGVFKQVIAEKELEKLKADADKIGAKLSSKEDELKPKQEELAKKEFEKLLVNQKSLDAIVKSLTLQHKSDPDNKLLLAAQKKKNEIDDLVANAELEKLIAEQNKKLLVAESNTGSSSSSTETKIEPSVIEQKAPVSAIKQEKIETVPGKEFSLESQVMVLKEDIKQLKINFSHANDAKKVCEAKVKHRGTKYPEAGKSLVEMKNDFEEKKRIERDERKESSALARYSMVAGKGNSPTDCLLTVKEDAPTENINRWVPSFSRSGR